MYSLKKKTEILAWLSVCEDVLFCYKDWSGQNVPRQPFEESEMMAGILLVCANENRSNLISDSNGSDELSGSSDGGRGHSGNQRLSSARRENSIHVKIILHPYKDKTKIYGQIKPFAGRSSQGRSPRELPNVKGYICSYKLSGVLIQTLYNF